ncbi:Mth938-like domain-containing protein [uncultured Rhodoblastus sp.]|uniref:Mth938-like domain-containing protein n=1 Tax=uncultured Rhodoblastus sp. TaxID=543037 RepID=UPI0025F19B35|nr:Mth938-like domain-containing protein [uncultured Rhodoblastus sp.]
MAEGRRYEGFTPGLHPIDGIAAGGFQFAGMTHRGSLLALPDGIHAYAPETFAAVDEASLAPLFALPRGSVDLLLFGCGAMLLPVPPALRQRLRALGIGCDPMSTAAACQTYNILLGEKRPVGAVLIAA